VTRVAYAKIGRSIILDEDKWQPGGNGDNEPVVMLRDLALRHPEITWVVAGRYSGTGKDLPPNVEVPKFPKVVASDKWKGGAKRATREDAEEYYRFTLELYESCDQALIHVGQHGTSNQPIPQDKDPTLTTKPQEVALLYAGPVINALNRLGERFEPVWVCQDPRNYLKSRDLKWYPRHPVLAQYDWEREQNHFRWGDPRSPHEVGYDGRARWRDPTSWATRHAYRYSGLELAGVPRWEDQDWPGFEERQDFGVLMNENRSYVKHNRADISKRWVLPFSPDVFHGRWSVEGQTKLGRAITPVTYDQVPHVLSATKATVTTPASGSEWATAKVWECFAVGTICFMHPRYDAQGHTVPLPGAADDPELDALAGWLRPRTPEELGARLQAVRESRETYEWLAAAQLKLLACARERNLIHKLLDERLGLHQADALTGKDPQ
jgi:hypothetical protein